MSIILRSAARARVAARQATQVRGAHFENTPQTCIPGGNTGKNGMAARMIVFSVVGWGLPVFVWQVCMAKAAGGN